LCNVSISGLIWNVMILFCMYTVFIYHITQHHNNSLDPWFAISFSVKSFCLYKECNKTRAPLFQFVLHPRDFFFVCSPFFELFLIKLWHCSMICYRDQREVRTLCNFSKISGDKFPDWLRIDKFSLEITSRHIEMFDGLPNPMICFKQTS